MYLDTPGTGVSYVVRCVCGEKLNLEPPGEEEDVDVVTGECYNCGFTVVNWYSAGNKWFSDIDDEVEVIENVSQ